MIIFLGARLCIVSEGFLVRLWWIGGFGIVVLEFILFIFVIIFRTVSP